MRTWRPFFNWDLTPVAMAGLAMLSSCSQQKEKPNVLLAIADDWSWPHASVNGEPMVSTPAFDRLANEGVLFENAFCSAPSCTPSRGALLTGQYHWRLRSGGNLWSTLPSEIPVYPEILEATGYFIGYTGKGWGPGSAAEGGRSRNPAGPVYNQIKQDAPQGMSRVDYAANFRTFLSNKPDNRPFCFWYGGYEPHRGYAYGHGRELGKDPGRVNVPGIFPDTDTVRQDLLDYYAEIEWFDQHLEQMLSLLDSLDLLDQTLVICTSDNGMPFPGAKSTLYEWGTHMPLAIRYGDLISKGVVSDALVSLTDLAPTILETAGIEIPGNMTGQSLLPLLKQKTKGIDRNFILTGKERHAWVRPEGKGYPSRAIRTDNYLLIYNFEPDRWPAGDPDFVPGVDHRLNYGDIDNSPTKQVMFNRQHKPEEEIRFRHAFGKHPKVELFDIENDPDNLRDLANDPDFRIVRDSLIEKLFYALEETGDPRVTAQAVLFDLYPYLGGARPMQIPDTIIYQAQGDISGEATDHSIVLQTRLTGAGKPGNHDIPGKAGIARFALDIDSLFLQPKFTAWKQAQAENDFILKWQIDTLQPGTRYYCRLEYGMHGNFIKRGTASSFRTTDKMNTNH